MTLSSPPVRRVESTMSVKLTVIGDPARDLGSNRVRVFERWGSIGREADWQLPDNLHTLGRIHVRVEKEGGAYYLVDNDSVNGTSHRGRWLGKGERVLLHSGDEFSIGPYTIAVRIESDADSAGGGLGELISGRKKLERPTGKDRPNSASSG